MRRTASYFLEFREQRVAATQCEGPDSLKPPDDGSSDGNGRHEVSDVTVYAGCCAFPVFEAEKHSLDDVALFVDFGDAIVFDRAVLFGRDDSGCAACRQLTVLIVVFISIAEQPSERIGYRANT